MNQLLGSLPNQLTDTLGSLPFFIPEIYLSALFLIVLLTDLFFGKSFAWLCKVIAIGGLMLILFKDHQQVQLLNFGSKFLFNDMLLLHKSAVSFKFIIDGTAVLLLVYFSLDMPLRTHAKGLSDLYSMVTASVLGLHLMIMAANLLSVYIAIEMVSLASYLLAAYCSESGFGAGAGLKYVLFGAVSSAIMLYGISILYALSGSLNYFSGNLIAGFSSANPALVSIAIVLLVAGIGFKLSFIPMHFWVPDVYQGAATPVTAYLSTLPKIAGFALLINFLTPFLFFGQWRTFDFRLFLSVVGIISMIAGNFAAIWQKNVKRMLAFSSIGHTGFALMAVVTFTPKGISALLFYLAVYAVANIAALILASFFADSTGAEDLDRYRGLGLKFPLAGVCFTIIIISLTGLPVTAGFNAKLLVFSSVYSVYQTNHNNWLLTLMLTGALTTVVSLFYYIKIPLYLFLKKQESQPAIQTTPQTQWLVIMAALLTFVVLVLGIYPAWLANFL